MDNPPPNNNYHHTQPSPTSPTSTSNTPPPDIKRKLELVPFSASNSNPKKTPPLPWTHQETLSLIQAYQEKCYSLKKGQLKATQWEEVSVTVAARCGYSFPSKSATQCRHKIEKLRKRYRAERLKPYPHSWQYFELMDNMERGPLPISSARPTMPAAEYQKNVNSVGYGGNYNKSYSEEGSHIYGGREFEKSQLKSINNIVRGGFVGLSGSNSSNRNVSSSVWTNRNVSGVVENVRGFRGLRTPMNLNQKGFFQNNESDEEEEDDDNDDEDELEEEEKEEEEIKGEVVGRELASEIRGFAERFMRTENKKIEMMRETEKYRMEMEKKRMDMILEAQRKFVDTIGRALGAHKKVKMAQEI